MTSIRRAAAEAGLSAIRVFPAKRSFRVGYVAKRLTRYLPIGGLNRLAQRPGRLRRLFARVIPLNPHDSLGLLLQRSASPIGSTRCSRNESCLEQLSASR
jgi:hypothetical protein